MVERDPGSKGIQPGGRLLQGSSEHVDADDLGKGRRQGIGAVIDVHRRGARPQRVYGIPGLTEFGAAGVSVKSRTQLQRPGDQTNQENEPEEHTWQTN